MNLMARVCGSVLAVTFKGVMWWIILGESRWHKCSRCRGSIVWSCVDSNVERCGGSSVQRCSIAVLCAGKGVCDAP